MKFKDFAHLLHPSIGAEQYSRLTVPYLKQSSLKTAWIFSTGTIKNRFRRITTEIQRSPAWQEKISPYVEPFGFSEYIGSFQDCAIQGLCEVFQKYIPDINLHNAADKLADLFASIIRESGCCHKRNRRGNRRKQTTMQNL